MRSPEAIPTRSLSSTADGTTRHWQIHTARPPAALARSRLQAGEPPRTTAMGKHSNSRTSTELQAGELGYKVEIERFETKVAGSDEISPVALSGSPACSDSRMAAG